MPFQNVHHGAKLELDKISDVTLSFSFVQPGLQQPPRGYDPMNRGTSASQPDLQQKPGGPGQNYENFPSSQFGGPPPGGDRDRYPPPGGDRYGSAQNQPSYMNHAELRNQYQQVRVYPQLLIYMKHEQHS